MKRRRQGWASLAAFCCLAAALRAEGREILWSAGSPSASQAAVVDFSSRQTYIDRVLRTARQTAGDQPQIDSALASHLCDVASRDVRMAAAEPEEFLANPEPSSMLVWCALALGIGAAGYGVRHRRNAGLQQQTA